MKSSPFRELFRLCGRTQKCQLFTLFAVSTIAIYAFHASSSAVSADHIAKDISEEILPNTAADYSKFRHSDAQHSRMPCLLCHVRSVGLTTPKMPGHQPCAACHVQQFADNSSAICSICHTNAATGAVKRFPPLRSFNIRFDHGRHRRQTSCSTCHSPSRRGVAFSVPSGATAHRSCFQCHGPKTEIGGKNIGSCGTCHQPGRPIRGSDWAKAFGMNFSHGKHLQRGKMNCASCHGVIAGAARGRQVSSPLASMHFSPAGRVSCGNCHDNKRAFGTADFANCKRCHEGNSFKF